MLQMEADSNREDRIKQLTLYDARKGMKGGLALAEKRGRDYMRKIASEGGKATVKRYGSAYMQKIGRAGAAERKRRLLNDPRTVRFFDGSIRRIVPYRKPKSRAKKPEYVNILLFPQDGIL